MTENYAYTRVFTGKFYIMQRGNNNKCARVNLSNEELFLGNSRASYKTYSY